MSGVPLRPTRFPSPTTWFTATSFFEAVGDQMARTLLPIIAVGTLGAGTATVGILNALGLSAFLLLGTAFGEIGDRLSRPTGMMTMSSAVRAAAACGGVIAWLMGAFHGPFGLTILVAIALAVGVADVAFTTGRSILVPRLVAPEQVRSVIGRVQAAAKVGTALAPAALTGLLLLGAPPWAWISVAGMYLCSILTQGRYRDTDGTRGTTLVRRSLRQQFDQGIGHLLQNSTLRRITTAHALTNSAVMAANTLLPVIALDTLRLDTSVFAALGLAGAMSGILGAALGSAITDWAGLRVVQIASALLQTAAAVSLLSGGVILHVLPGPALLWIGVYYAVSGFSTSVSAVAGSDLVVRLTPRSSIGIVSGAQRTTTMGVMPLSALAAGIVGTSAGIGPACALWCVLALLAALPCLRLTEPQDASTV